MMAFCYYCILFVSKLTSLNPGMTNFLGHSFKMLLTRPLPSIIYSSLHVDMSVLSRLRTATQFARPVSRTKKYCSLIN